MSTPWVADPVIGWRILLVADLETLPRSVDLGERLTALYAAQDWPGAPTVLESSLDADELAASLDAGSSAPLLVGTAGSSLVLSGHHRDVDGLGLLTALAALTGGAVASSARGVGGRPRRPHATGVVRRLVEALLAPPAGVDLPRPDVPREHDSLVRRETGQVRTHELVLAGVRAVQSVRRHERRARLRDRRVAISVGVGRPDPGPRIADRSELLRLRHVTTGTPVRDLLRTAPLEPAIGRSGTSGSRGGRVGAGPGLLDRLSTALMARLRPRLGSTLLVSHLGDVHAPGVRSIAFYPVTAGGSGISLGAANVRGRTVLTARARGYDVDATTLARLLDAVVTASRAAGPGTRPPGDPVRP